MNIQMPNDKSVGKIHSSIKSSIILSDDKYWTIKVGQYQRHLLGYLLGKSICNIAEVKVPTIEEQFEIKSIFGISFARPLAPETIFVVRVANTYNLSELPCQTLERSVASELVYSIWIRRRDTHSDNREYLECGVPVFYDSHIAFLEEPQWAHSTMFFNDAPDYGHPAFWRVKETLEKMTTDKARDVNPRENKAWHYVNNIENFKRELETAKEKIYKLDTNHIKQTISLAGFTISQIEILSQFLEQNRSTLDEDIKQLVKIIFN